MYLSAAMANGPDEIREPQGRAGVDGGECGAVGGVAGPSGERAAGRPQGTCQPGRLLLPHRSRRWLSAYTLEHVSREESLQHTETMSIDRPAEEVWAFVGDVRWWPKWTADISDVEVSADELSAGTQLSYKFRGRPTHPTIASYQQGREIGISASEDRYEFAESITLHPGGDETEVSFTMSFEPTVWWMKGIAAALGPLQGHSAGTLNEKEMRSLKAAVEADASQQA